MSGVRAEKVLRLMWQLRREEVLARDGRRYYEMRREPDGPVAFYFRERFKSRDA